MAEGLQRQRWCFVRCVRPTCCRAAPLLQGPGVLCARPHTAARLHARPPLDPCTFFPACLCCHPGVSAVDSDVTGHSGTLTMHRALPQPTNNPHLEEKVTQKLLWSALPPDLPQVPGGPTLTSTSRWAVEAPIESFLLILFAIRSQMMIARQVRVPAHAYAASLLRRASSSPLSRAISSVRSPLSDPLD